jgi:hypothetical protein
MSRLDGTLTEIWLRHDIGGLILRAPIGLACCFSRLAGRGHLERPYQKGACVKLVFFQHPTQNYACS